MRSCFFLKMRSLKADMNYLKKQTNFWQREDNEKECFSIRPKIVIHSLEMWVLQFPTKLFHITVVIFVNKTDMFLFLPDDGFDDQILYTFPDSICVYTLSLHIVPQCLQTPRNKQWNTVCKEMCSF